MSSDFDSRTVNAALAPTRFAGAITHFTTVPSTNTLALETAQRGGEGVFVADEQTSGRGRGGHIWHSARGAGLYLSAIVRPRMALDRALWLALATGLACQAAIAKTIGLKPDIRWPNDLLLNGRKCGGILVETSAQTSGHTSTLRFAVIGIGLNLNHTEFPGDLADLATSMRIETGRNVDRELLLVEILLALDNEIALLERETADQKTDSGLLDRFSAASSWVSGRRVHVEENGGYTGVTDGLDSAGFLRVLTDDGQLRTVLSGGVRPEQGRESHAASH